MPKFNPPESFDFTKPSEWPEWKTRFERFRIATKLHKEDKEIQVSSLIYAMGMQAEHIFKSFVFGDGEDAESYDDVMGKFESYFIPKRNIIHERAVFHTRVQAQGESVETFIRSLHELAEHCSFDKKSEEIRDMLVIGIRDKELSERLQLTEKLDLNKACEMVRNSELVKSQIKDLQSKNLDAVHVGARNQPVRKPPRRGQGRGAQGRHTGSQYHSVKTHKPSFPLCTQCNQRHEQIESECPARGRRCRKCKRFNHFAVCCKTKTHGSQQHQVRQVVQDDSYDDDTYFLGAINNNDTEAWKVKLKVNRRLLTFKIDTGADVSIMDETTYHSLRPKPRLDPVTNPLKSPGGVLSCLGKFSTTIKHKGKLYTLTIHVISGCVTDNLLSRSAAHTMGLVFKVDDVGVQESVFENCGRMVGEPVKIVLRDDARPYCLTTARRIPFPIMPKVKAELDRLENDGIIVKVTAPTDWCAPIVPVIKKNGSVRICVDLKRLNEAVKRETYMLPNLDDIAPKLSGSIVFSKLDATSGFHQIPLDEASCLLTTFITPFGRYCYRRLPFGITSAPEIFQRRMTEILDGLDGVETIIDDVLIYGRTQSEHDERLERVLNRIRDAGIKLNRDKCEFSKDRIEYFGHVICKDGVLPSPQRVTALQELPAPSNVAELRRTIGMIMYIGRFIPDLSSIIHPLTDLLKADVAWTWDEPQIEAFRTVKEALTKAPVLSFYDPSKPITVSADASSYGLGAAIFQTFGQELKPIAFASRTLTDAEKKYAQIEKECLAAVWACEKFDRYITGVESFRLITDHKPLVPLINTQDLNRSPLRCQRLLMRLRRYNAIAEHVPGKQLVVPDTLSRSPLNVVESSTAGDVDAYVSSVTSTKAISDRRLDEIRTATENDPILQEVINLTRYGWPDREQSIRPEVRDYFASRYNYSACDDLLFYNDRIVMPEVMRAETIQSLHSGHLGLNKCRERAKSTVWWPGISKDLEQAVRSCAFCNKHRSAQRKEPLMATPMPERPWERVGADLCDHDGKQYLVVVDYFSRYLEIVHLDSTTSNVVIGKLKNMFARWGIPNEFVSDNGPQFSSLAFREFATQYGFTHITSSPHYPQANGEAESGVKIAKRILEQPDIFIALMAYRSTPISVTGCSPAELIMGRKIRTTVPMKPAKLQPEWPDLEQVRKKDAQTKLKMKENFNTGHGARTLTP